MRTASTASHRHRKLQLALLGTLPVLALVLPETALAATASNTASLTLPAGVTDPDLTNNTVTDTDTVLSAVVPTTESGTVTAGTTATAITDVRTNDTINGVTATSSNSTITQSGSWPTGITLNTTTGAVSVAGTVAPGTYTVTYQLCDLATPTATCNTVTDTITVNAAVVPTTESGTVTAGTTATAIADVRANDTINGVTATSSNSTITQSGSWPTGITLNPTTGAVSVAGTVAPGTYTVTYQLCDLATPTATCNTVTDTITVNASVVPTTESGTVTAGTTATAIADVRANDTINGVTATSSNSTITQSGSWPSGITLNPTTGAVSVAGTVAPGTYTVTYQLCDLATPTATCNTVTDTVTVNASVVPNTESGTGLALTASTPITDVRANDTINGVTATSSNSTIATDPANPLPAGFSLNTTTGAISVDNTVTAGTYSVWYELCDKTTPTAICATVKDTVTISNRQADLVLAKSNGATSVTSGQTTTYTLTVTNNGPDSVTGVVVQDTPGAGLTCPTTNPLSFGGTGGIPSGSFTVANLTGSGVTLGTLGNGQNITITYSCTVN